MRREESAGHKKEGEKGRKNIERKDCEDHMEEVETRTRRGCWEAP